MKQKPLLKPPSHCFWLDYNLSKHLPVEFATFLQWEGVLMNWKCRKCCKKAFENAFSLQKIRKNDPNSIKTMPKAWKRGPQSPSPMCDHFSEALVDFTMQNWGEIGQKLKRLISLFDQMQGKGVLTNLYWYVLPACVPQYFSAARPLYFLLTHCLGSQFCSRLIIYAHSEPCHCSKSRSIVV